MLRRLCLALLLVVSSSALSGQALGVLRIRVVLAGADGTTTPVTRHALLISDNPPTVETRRVLTTRDGTATVRLRPGNYTVESDEPLAFRGQSYHWVQRLDVGAGETLLALTADNARIEATTAATATSASTIGTDPSFLLSQWQDSVVAIWTPTTRASGFLIDAKGLVVTNQRAIGSATSVEVQFTPAIKVAATVIETDPARDVAVLWLDPTVVAAVRALPLDCAQTTRPAVVSGQDLFAIGAPLRGDKRMAFGSVSSVEARATAADLRLAAGSAGGPVFTADGRVIGITTVEDGNASNRLAGSRVVRVDQACEVVAAAERKLTAAMPPVGTHLPVEPVGPFPVNRLEQIVKGRVGSLNPYQMSSSDFDIAFITPVHTYGAQHMAEQARGRERGSGSRAPDSGPATRPLMDFGNWSDYVGDFPPVLLVRVTPKMVENFWTTVGRAAARTQGMALPPVKRVKTGFSRLRAFCGDSEVTPIHPFTLERRVSERAFLYEGLYVFDRDALGPTCPSVTLVLYSEKEPAKGDTRVVDGTLVQQVWNDFEGYRSK